MGQLLTQVRGSCFIKTALPRVPGDGRRSKGKFPHLLDTPPQAWPLCILTSWPQWWPGPPVARILTLIGCPHSQVRRAPHISGHARHSCGPSSWVLLAASGPSAPSCCLTPPRHGGRWWLLGRRGGGGRRGCQSACYCPDLRGRLSGTPTRGNEIVWRHFSHRCLISAGKKTVCVWRRVCVRARVRAILQTPWMPVWVRFTAWLLTIWIMSVWFYDLSTKCESLKSVCVWGGCQKITWWHKGREGGDWWDTALEKTVKRWKQGFRWWHSD